MNILDPRKVNDKDYEWQIKEFLQLITNKISLNSTNDIYGTFKDLSKNFEELALILLMERNLWIKIVSYLNTEMSKSDCLKFKYEDIMNKMKEGIH